MIHTLKHQIEHCLKLYPESRNSDITLTIKLWEEFYGVSNSINIKQLYNLPREDAIKRIRAKFNAKGLYYPTNIDVLKKRGLQENTWRQNMHYPTKEETYYPRHSESYIDKNIINNQPLTLF